MESSSRRVSQEKGSLSANDSGWQKAISDQEALFLGLKKGQGMEKKGMAPGKRAWH